VAFGQQPSQREVKRDPQALALLSEVVSSGGGIGAIKAIDDFRSSGNITLEQSGKEIHGTFLIKARGALNQLRLEIDTAPGREVLTIDGTAMSRKQPDGKLRQIQNQHTDNIGSTINPLPQLASALTDADTSVTDLGTFETDGPTLRRIAIQKILPRKEDIVGSLSNLTKREFDIDSQTLRVVSINELLPLDGHLLPTIKHRIIFGDYRPISGVLFPYTATEFISDQKLSTMALQEVQVNIGVQDSDFRQ
jgi:hypothetical protein